MAVTVKDKEGKIHTFPTGSTPEKIAQALKVNYIPKKEEGIGDILKRKAKEAWNKEELIPPGRLIKAGLMGMLEGGKNIGDSLAAPLRKYIPESMKVVPEINPKEMFDMKNQSMLEKLVSSGAQYSPLIAAGPMGLLADTAAGSAYGASQSPQDKTFGAEVGGGSNAAFNILNKLVTRSNPITKMASKALLGGSIGYGVGGNEGALEGSVLAPIGSKLAKKAGFIGNPSEEIMSNIKPNEVSQRAEAGLRLKTPLTPGEASGRPDITSQESAIGKSGEAARERVKIGQERINQQKAAIDNLMKTINPSDEIASFDVRKAAQDSIGQMEKARNEAVDPIYKIAHEKKVAPNLISSLRKSDRNISNAIDEAMHDPKYQVEGELLNVPENSIKMLDYAKRNLDAKIEQAKNFGDNDAVRVLTNSKNKLLNKIDGFSPDYKEARKVYSELSAPIEEVKNSKLGQISNMQDVNLKNISKNIFDPSQTDIKVLEKIKNHIQEQNPGAWDKIVKNEMNRLMTQGKNKGITGRSFFDNVLSNDRRFNQFHTALEHNHKALEQLNDMKTAWEHLINMETPRTAAGQSKTSMNIARSSVQSIVDMYNNLLGGEKHIKALKYLYSDKWVQDLNKVKSLPKGEQKHMMSILIGKTIAPAYLLDNEK